MYNERISRLSLEAKQARHRADAAMRKLRDLVQACKTQDLNTISNLAVQVDTDTIAPPYSEKPQWEQQVCRIKRGFHFLFKKQQNGFALLFRPYVLFMWAKHILHHCSISDVLYHFFQLWH